MYNTRLHTAKLRASVGIGIKQQSVYLGAALYQ